jgi:hypothetical protein
MDGNGRGAEYIVVHGVDMFINHNICPNLKCRCAGLSAAGCGAYCVVCSDKVATVVARLKDRTCHVGCHGIEGRPVHKWGWINTGDSKSRTVKCPHCSAVVGRDFQHQLRHTVGSHPCLILSLVHAGSLSFSLCFFFSAFVHLLISSLSLDLCLLCSLFLSLSLGNLCVDAGASPQHL